MTATATWWAPPPPPLDIWAAVRAQAPDTDDHTARHRRGLVRLPYDLGPDEPAGALVEAWVCCDPRCAGVELGRHVLNINHCCCDQFCPDPIADRRHTAGLGRLRFLGWYHGPFTAWWEPVGGAR